MGERAIGNVFRRLTRGSTRTTILLDELGNLFERLGTTQWRSFLGELRNYTQYGNLRFIASCFQELHLRQQDGFGGPLINLGNTLRLGLFDDSEVSDFVSMPLEFWGSMEKRHRRSLTDQVVRVVGALRIADSIPETRLPLA